MKTPFGTDVNQPSDQGARKRRWPLFAVIGIALSLLVGASFAASISINSGSDIEFGQGSQDVVTCATTNLVPTFESDYTNAAGFTLGRLMLAGVANGCRGKYILVTLYSAGDTKVDEVLFSPDSGNTHTGTYTLDTETGAPCTGTEVPLTSVGDPVYCGPETGTNDGLAATTDSTTIVDMTVESFDTAPTTTL